MEAMRNDSVCSLGSGSKAIWHVNPLDFPFPLMMVQIIVIVLTSQVLYICMRPLGQHKFVSHLLAGIILGPCVMGNNAKYRRIFLGEEANMGLFDTISKIGVVYSLFLVSVKFDVSMLRRTAKNAWKISLASFIFPPIVFFATVYPIFSKVSGFTGGFMLLVLFVGTLTFSFFPVIVQVLEELNLMTSELGQLALSSSMFSDAMQWVFSVITLVTMKKDAVEGIGTLFSLLALLAFSIFVLRPLMKLITKRLPEGKEVDQNFVIAVQLGVLVMAFVSDIIGMRHTSGPIILGLVMPYGQELGATIVARTETLVTEFFMPLYFFRIGSGIDVTSISDWKSFAKLETIIVVSYAAKFMGVSVAGMFAKLSFKNSLVLSMVMSIKGLVDLIAYTRWRDMQIIDKQLYTQLVLSMVGITMLLTPLIRFFYVLKIRRGSSMSDPQFRLNIQSLPPRNEIFRILCCVHNEESVPNIINLLEVSNPTEASPITAYVVHAVEFIGRSAPLLVPYKHHKIRRSYSLTNKMVQAFKNYSKSSRGPVMIRPYTMVAPYKSMHETISRLALDKFVPLIIIPFHENHQSLVLSNMTGAIRQFNYNVQAYAPCTVGILVDRGFPLQMNIHNFTYSVVVFFIGGPDDREALAYASRMLDNPNVEMTVFRFIVRVIETETKLDEEIEFSLDESLIDEFKLGNLGNERLNWNEIEVENAVQVMTAITKSQGQYDLAMVGRRHADVSLKDEEMVDFMQNPELGVIGDMLASADFCNGRVNVLVMQESRELRIGAFRSGGSGRNSDSKSGFN
uniref:cation/H(+) antiporter 15-like n=1 Tax=Fragaria vesca subsp. vesca TaxID=101020 RepID=UPI0005CB1925|nr:PREDICTED: cation/H(+) antiporter 15-like [Fragaria vesca subsp. vesca]